MSQILVLGKEREMIHYSIQHTADVIRHEYHDDSVLNYPEGSFRRKPEYVCYEYLERKPKNVKKQIAMWMFQHLLSDDNGNKDFVIIEDPAGVRPGDVLDLIEPCSRRALRCIVTDVPDNLTGFGLKDGFGVVEAEIVGEKVGTFRRKE